MKLKQKIHPRLLGFDIDGVVADTAGAFIRLAREDYGVPDLALEDITEFEVENCLSLPPALMEEIFQRLLLDPKEAGLQPMDQAVGVLRELARAAPLTFVTARPHRPPIADWLRTILGETVFENSRLVAMGEHDNKAAYIKKLGLQFFVDDRAQTCIGLSREGITPIVYNQPWNMGKHDLPTVDNWMAIHDLCLK